MLLLLKTARAEGKPPTLFIGAHGMFARSTRECIEGEWFDDPIPQTEYTVLAPPCGTGAVSILQ